MTLLQILKESNQKIGLIKPHEINLDYLELRAIEYIREARIGNYNESLKRAITLLAMAREKHGPDTGSA